MAAEQLAASCSITDDDPLTDRLEKRGLTVEHLQRYQCTQDVLVRLSKMMDNWETIGFWLDLTKVEMKAIKVDSSSEEERRIQMLTKWMEKQGSEATYEVLIEALKEYGRIDIVEKALDHLKEIVDDEGVDSDNLQEEDVRLLCGCGKCTLEDFMKNGCPNPGAQRQFPLLNVTQLASQKLIARLIQESKKVVEKFAALLYKISICLNLRDDIDADHLFFYITPQMRCTFLTEPSYTEVQEKLRNAKTKGEILKILESHVSWFNHSLLGSVVKFFKLEVEEYEDYVENHLSPFLQKSLFEIPNKSSDCFQGSGQFVLKMTIPPDPPQHKLSANVLISLKNEVAVAFGISIDALEFCSYDSGCFELKFSAPDLILREMFNNNRRQLLETLQNIASIIPGVKIEAVKFKDQSYEIKVQEIKSDSTKFCHHKARMTKIDRMFASLVVQLMKSIASSATLEDVKKFLIELLAKRSFGREAESLPIFSSEMIQDVDSFRDLMLLMKNYWSFFNYSLFEKLVKKFGSKVATLSSYLANLQELSLSEVPALLHHREFVDGFSKDILLVTTKGVFFDLSVEELITIHDRVARTLRVERYALLLRRIKREENQLEFLISEACNTDLSKFSNLDFSSLDEVHVLGLQYQGIIRNQLTNKDYDSDIDEAPSEHDSDLDSGHETGGTLSGISDIEHVASQDSKIETSESANSNTDPKVTDRISTNDQASDDRVDPLKLLEEIAQTAPDDSDETKTLPSPVETVKCEDLESEVLQKDYSEDEWPSFENTSTRKISTGHHLPSTSPHSETQSSYPIDQSVSAVEYKGVFSVCGICLKSGDNNESLISKKCYYPDYHRTTQLICAAWDFSSRRLIGISPRPRIRTMTGMFQLCNRQKCRGPGHCTYAHSSLECEAWNYDLVKEREASFNVSGCVSTVGAIFSPTSRSQSLSAGTHAPITESPLRSKSAPFPANVIGLSAATNPLDAFSSQMSPIMTVNTSATALANVTPPAPPASSTHELQMKSESQIKHELNHKEREKWKVNFASRVTATVLRDEVVTPELTAANYRDKFYYLLCFEESEHIRLLTDKCDGQYKLQSCQRERSSGVRSPQYVCPMLGMTGDQIQYAAQASESVFFIDENNEDLCKGEVHRSNFSAITEKFFVSLSEEAFRKIQSRNVHLGSGWYRVRVEFEVKHSYFDTLHQAVISIPDSMIKKITPTVSSALSSFTEQSTAINPTKLISYEYDDLFLDTNEQFQALKAILQSPVDFPVIVSGPFGSGKTRIIARAAYEFILARLRTQTSAQTRILLCAHHANTIETYVSKYFKPAFSRRSGVKIIRIVRHYDQQPMDEPSLNILNMTLFDLKNGIVRGRHIKDPVLVIITTYTSSLQVAKILSSYRFTHILLDEAAQVREPEAIAALSLGDINTKIAIAGDSKQVGPSVLVLGDKSKEYGLSVSLLERLEKKYQALMSGEQECPYLKKLNKNYRCAPEIVEFLSETVYGYSIKCADMVCPLSHPAVKFPCIFYWSEPGDQEKLSMTDLMTREADAVLRQAQHYFSKWPNEWSRAKVRQRDVCIISPFRTQLNILKPKMKELGMRNINLLPSYLIQGHEFQAVILSTFEPLEEDGTSSNPTKSLVNPKIFNTVLSRSKSFVVAIGDPFVLLRAEKEFPERCWKHYLSTCLKNDSVFFPEHYDRNMRRESKEKLAREIGVSSPQRSRSQ